MGKRDFVRREAKKPKKEAKKIVSTPILPAEPPREVEVIGKGKKRKAEEEE